MLGINIYKISSLIKKTIAEILLTHDFNDIDGQNILLFVSNVTLSADAKNATIFLEEWCDLKIFKP